MPRAELLGLGFKLQGLSADFRPEVIAKDTVDGEAFRLLQELQGQGKPHPQPFVEVPVIDTGRLPGLGLGQGQLFPQLGHSRAAQLSCSSRTVSNCSRVKARWQGGMPPASSFSISPAW